MAVHREKYADTPKGSSKAQLLEPKEHLQRMLSSSTPPTTSRPPSRTVKAALDHLLERLTNVPTPAGPTPRELGLPAATTLLPIVGTSTGASSSTADRA
ncbi:MULTISPECIES: hypothetical protein [unclassified Streptomyces]|uniref:hypothetical protein n=1 Tax=unclassified Streptomyces TaxID=2593676 RepID=UPI002E25F1E2